MPYYAVLRVRHIMPYRFGKPYFEVSFRMVGGDSVVDRTKWPWLAAFTHNEGNNYFCGGSLISKRHVLSGKENDKVAINFTYLMKRKICLRIFCVDQLNCNSKIIFYSRSLLSTKKIFRSSSS